MKKRYHAPGNEYFNFIIDPHIIFYAGVVVLGLLTIYVFRNRCNISKNILLEAIFLLIASWIMFYLTLKSDKKESITALAGIIGTTLPALTYGIIKSNKK